MSKSSQRNDSKDPLSAFWALFVILAFVAFPYVMPILGYVPVFLVAYVFGVIVVKATMNADTAKDKFRCIVGPAGVLLLGLYLLVGLPMTLKFFGEKVYTGILETDFMTWVFQQAFTLWNDLVDLMPGILRSFREAKQKMMITGDVSYLLRLELI